MNPVTEIKDAAKSAFTLKNFLYILLSVALLFLVASIFGFTQWVVDPWGQAKAAWEKNKSKAGVILVFATTAAATATNALSL